MSDFEPGGPLEYSLRALAGKSFHAVKFCAAEYSAPFAVCTLCGKRIVENPADGEEARGYVGLDVLERARGGGEYLHWDWVCEECFGRFRELAGWEMLPGPVDLATHARFRRFKVRLEREIEMDAPAPGVRYDLQLTWSPADVVAIAGAQGRELSLDETSRLLRRYRWRLMAAVDEAGLRLIGGLIGDDHASRGEG